MEGSYSDFQDPTEGIRNGAGPTFSPGLEKQKQKTKRSVFWGLKGDHRWGTVLVGLGAQEVWGWPLSFLS